MSWRLALQLAVRHLVAGGWQTVLITAGVAVAVVLVIFISALIGGVQRNITDSVTASLPHVVVSAADPVARVEAPAGMRVTAEVRKRPRQRVLLQNWPLLERELRNFPHVVGVAPAVTGQAFISKGGKEESVRLTGVDPEKYNRVVRLSDDIYQGRLLGLRADEIVIGYKLAEELGVSVGERVRMTSSSTSESFRVAGLMSTGSDAIDTGWALMPLRAGQSLLDTGAEVTSLLITIDKIFEANAVAARIEGAFDIKAESWMQENADLLNALRAQSSSRDLISIFSLAAAGFAIASVLIVSVLKRSKEIGILKAIGAKGRFVLLVYALEGLGIAIIGTGAGLLAGTGMMTALSRITRAATIPGKPPEPLFPSDLTPALLVTTAIAAMLVTVIASIIPARHAGKLDPVEVIRRG